jgi:magnesium transporter
MADALASEVLGSIARHEDMSGRIRRNVMDTTVGFINISQNKIIKIFSVASVALLPPTLVASIYGMNLQFPEFALLGQWAYPYVVALMFLSAALPMWFGYRRGWLR